jgi:hypothetical protein
MIGPALLLALQSTTAVPIDPAPLEPGRWVFRETVEPGTGARAVSATLVSNDRRVRLLVRCDSSYARTVSLQLLRNRPGDAVFSLPASLTGAADEPFDLDWEQAPVGLFVRDGDEDAMATDAAAAMAGAPGRLKVALNDRSGGQIVSEFDNRSDREQIRRVLDACAPLGQTAARP